MVLFPGFHPAGMITLSESISFRAATVLSRLSILRPTYLNTYSFTFFIQLKVFNLMTRLLETLFIQI